MNWPLNVTALRRSSVTKTGDYTAKTSDFTIRVDASAGPVTIGAPPASTNFGQLIFVKKIDATANQVTFNPVDLVDGGDSVAITTQNETKLFQSNGESYDVLF